MVCPYYGREIPDASSLGLKPDQIYQLLRDPVELAKGAPTAANLPLLIEHVIHSADTPQQDSTVGVVGSDVRFEAPYLKASLGVWTQEAIDLIESHAQEQLSCGYRYRADMTPGAFDGAPYDGVMRDLVFNHVALVAQGRAGPDVLVADSILLEFPRMKNAALIARLKPFLATDAKADALDAEIEKQKAQDADAQAAKDAEHYGMSQEQWDGATEEEREKAKEKWAEDCAAKDAKAAKDQAAKDAKAAKDAGEPKKPDDGAGKPAKDAAITMDAMNAAIAAATTKAVAEAVTRTNALHEARTAVAPVVGIVAFDSAEEVYAFALKHLAVDMAGLPAAAYKPVFTEVAKARGAKPAPRLANDSATVTAFPSMSRIKVA